MSRTLGEIQFQLLKTPHGAGTDRELLRDLINDRASQMYSAYDWSRLEVRDYITTVDVYETGTISVTHDGQTLTGTATVWTLAMQGRAIRIAGRSEYSIFSFVSATSGTIDTPYEGDTDTAATYKIYQNVFTLPSYFSQLDAVLIPETEDELDQISREELDVIDPNRDTFGPPQCYAPYEDKDGRIQVELWPIPETAASYPIRGRRKAERLVETSEQFPSWVNTEAVVVGVEADLLMLKEKVSLAQLKEAKYQELLGKMIGEDADRKPAKVLKMHERYTNHRVVRAMGSYRDRRWLQLHRSD